jgi:hypothetical protein
MGFDAGEFGGGLRVIDLQTGQEEQVPFRSGSGWPVRCLKAAPDGRVWALEGVAHGTVRWGAIHVRSGDAWELHCSSTEGELANWDLPPASLDALAFDADARLYVLSGNLGLARYEGGAWTRLTPGWPDFFYVQSLLVTPGGVAVIGAGDQGIMLLNLQSGEIRRIAFKG